MTDPVEQAIAKMREDARHWQRRTHALDTMVGPKTPQLRTFRERRINALCEHCGKPRRPEDLASVAGCSVCKDDQTCRNRALGWRAAKYRDTA